MKSDANTLPLPAAVQDYLHAKATPEQLDDAKRLIQLLSAITGEPAAMWGSSIVGFGSYRYTYASGRSGVASLAGFAVRGKEFALYLAPDWDGSDALLRLGAHRSGKGCLYLKKLTDIDVVALDQLISASVEELRRRYPSQEDR
ncbi:DUF1801 domain-containing protein [Roseateles chitinivorans]|uniref:DUF1801 domain-containing protein n=1 Tax=Roseateles chitinivorans TaxID=2917965 RepID=UPI003D66B7D7